MKEFKSVTVDFYLEYGVSEKFMVVENLIKEGWKLNVINSDIPKNDYPKANVHISLYKTYTEED
jgi:hypothetical protein